jgi:TonB family protein
MKRTVLLALGVICLLSFGAMAQSQQTPETVYRVGGTGGASAPKCTPTEPKYTDEALKAHIEGTVKLNTIFHKDGSIEVVKVIERLGYGLDEAAQNSLKSWKCIPGEVNGQPVAVQAEVAINFQLNPAKP